jgi:hypothetical protein
MEVSGRFQAPATLSPSTHWIWDWVGPRSGLDAVDKRQIPCLCQESKPNFSVVQPIACRYINWLIPAPMYFDIQLEIQDSPSQLDHCWAHVFGESDIISIRIPDLELFNSWTVAIRKWQESNIQVVMLLLRSVNFNCQNPFFLIHSVNNVKLSISVPSFISSWPFLEFFLSFLPFSLSLFTAPNFHTI